MKLIIAQGTPVVPSADLDAITDRAEAFLQVNIGLHYVKGSETRILLQKSGETVSDSGVPAPHIPGSGLVRLLRLPFVHMHYIRTIVSAIQRSPDVQGGTFIARSWLPCLAGLRAKRAGLVDTVVFWVNDFYPAGDSGLDGIFNRIFRMIDRYLVRRADRVWYLSQRLFDAHIDSDGKRLAACPEQVVPCLYDPHPEVFPLWDENALHSFVYMGLVKLGQGLDVILPAVAAARESIDNLKLDVVGGGPDLEHFKAQAEELGVSDIVTFHGFVEEDSEVHRIVGRSAAAFCMYDPAVIRHAYYTLNSKVHMYIGCGVPVLITESSGSYDYVMNAGAGIPAEYSPESVASSMAQLCSSLETYRPYRKAAHQLVDGFAREAENLASAIEDAVFKR